MTMAAWDFLFKNRSTKQTIAKNIFWLTSSQMGSRFIRAVLVIYAARTLGATQYGEFTLGLSIAALLMLFSDAGVSPVVTREVAKDAQMRARWVATGLVLKFLLLVLSAAVIVVVAPYFTNIPAARSLLPILALVLFLDGLRDFGFAIIRALEIMQWEALINVSVNALVVLVGLAALSLWPTPLYLALAYLLGSVVGVFGVALALRRYLRGLREHIDRTLFHQIMSTAWPFITWSILGSVLVYTDSIMLGWLRDASAVGFYNAAYKPIQLLFALPGLLAAGAFPTFARRAADGSLLKPLVKAFGLVMLIALPLTCGGIVLGSPIIRSLYGSAYQGSVASFQVLLLLVLLQFPALILGNAVFAHDRHFEMIWYVAAGAVANLLLNWVLIPIYGGPGAAVATVVAQTISVVGAFVVLQRIHPFSALAPIWRGVVATLLMLLVVAAAFLLGINVWFTIGLGSIVYCVALWLLKEPLLREVLALLQLP